VEVKIRKVFIEAVEGGGCLFQGDREGIGFSAFGAGIYGERGGGGT
jgi:hypothetical protein